MHMPNQYLTLDCNSFLPHPFQFIIHYISFNTTQSEPRCLQTSIIYKHTHKNIMSHVCISLPKQGTSTPIVHTCVKLWNRGHDKFKASFNMTFSLNTYPKFLSSHDRNLNPQTSSLLLRFLLSLYHFFPENYKTAIKPTVFKIHYTCNSNKHPPACALVIFLILTVGLVERWSLEGTDGKLTKLQAGRLWLLAGSKNVPLQT